MIKSAKIINSLLDSTGIDKAVRKILISRSLSSYNRNEEAKRQSDLFAQEQKRQRENVGRVEKIEVNYIGLPDKATLIMNKNISTPYDCAKHLSETLMNKAAVALLNHETYWHMHKPLPESCTLDFLHYNITQPAIVNKAFWRTGSFILGAVINDAFKDKVDVQLHSFPSPNVKSGSFVYDVAMSLDDWQPTDSELKVLSIETKKFCMADHHIECLDVDADFALEMFKHNPYKTQQIPNIAAQSNGNVTIFKVGNHVDISRGPMVTNTNHFGRISVANVIKLETETESGPLYRFQGVALPHCISLNHFAYSLLEERAKKLNPARLPGSHTVNEDYNHISTAVA